MSSNNNNTTTSSSNPITVINSNEAKIVKLEAEREFVKKLLNLEDEDAIKNYECTAEEADFRMYKRYSFDKLEKKESELSQEIISLRNLSSSSGKSFFISIFLIFIYLCIYYILEYILFIYVCLFLILQEETTQKKL